VLELEHRLRLHDGTERWALTKAKLEEPLGEGGVWRGTTMDITDRKRAESTLQTEHQVTRILAAGGDDDSVLPPLLKVLGTRLGMVCAVQWLAEGAHALRCERVSCSDKVDRSERVHMLLQEHEAAEAPKGESPRQDRPRCAPVSRVSRSHGRSSIEPLREGSCEVSHVPPKGPSCARVTVARAFHG